MVFRPNRQGKKEILWTPEDGIVAIVSNNVNGTGGCLQYVTYFSKQQFESNIPGKSIERKCIYLQDVSWVSPYALLLAGCQSMSYIVE